MFYHSEMFQKIDPAYKHRVLHILEMSDILEVALYRLAHGKNITQNTIENNDSTYSTKPKNFLKNKRKPSKISYLLLCLKLILNKN